MANYPGTNIAELVVDEPGTRIGGNWGTRLAAALAHLFTNKMDKSSLVYDVTDYGAVAGQDCLAAFQNCIAAMPAGATLWVPPLPIGQKYLLSAPLVIDKGIRVKGSLTRVKGAGGGLYGSALAPTSAAAQSTMNALIQVTALYTHFENIGLVGTGIVNGSVGLLFSGGTGGGSTPEDGNLGGDTGSHASTATGVMAIQFGAGIEFGSDSDHIYLDNCVSSGNQDGIRIGANNRFDFLLERCSIEGNTRSSIHLPADANVVNVTLIRCHLGFSNYGILQDNPTTAGYGIAGLTLLDSPIESVSQQHIKLYNGGNIHIQGGYWVWKTSPPALAAFEIANVSAGAIWFSTRLEPNFPNASSEAVIKITGYTNHPVYINGPLNGFAQKWVNFGPTVNMDRIFVQGLPYGGQTKGAQAVQVTQSGTDQTVISYAPAYHGPYVFRAYIRVTTESVVTLKFTYNDGDAAREVFMVNAQTLTPGQYSYTWFAQCYTYNSVAVRVRASVLNAVRVTANISPQTNN